MLDLHKFWMVVVGLVIVVAVFLGFRQSERHKGALAVLFHQADSTHKADSLASLRAVDSLAQVNARLGTLAIAAQGKAKAYEAAKVTDDTVAAHLASARDSLAKLIADSLATMAELRASGLRLIAASDSAERAHKIERQSADSALAAAKRTYTFAIDSVGKAANRAIQSAVKRATDAEGETKLAKQLLPSTLGGWLKVGGIVLGSVELGRMSAAKFP